MTNSSDRLTRFLMLSAIAGLLVTPAVAWAQTKTPDLLGISVGMSANVARAALQKRMPGSIQMQDAGAGYFSLSITDPMNSETVKVYVTMAPNEPAVWMMQRGQNFTAQNPMTKAALLGALHDKYGKETLTARGGSYLYWIFDQSGRLLTSADETLTMCSGNMFVNRVRQGPLPSPPPIEKMCTNSFYAVTAMLNSADDQLLIVYTIELVNLPYALRAATITGNAINGEAEKERQDLINKANRKPAL